ncbi:MAG: response regulator transcription factor [Sarcina sp.]
MDEKSIREILKIAFLREGFEVRVAEDLKKGLKLFEEFKPVIVILDLMLPDGSGFEICKKIKNIFEEGIFINEDERTAKKDGRVLKLNKKEFELLNLFYKNRNIVFSREKLLERIWGYDYEEDDRTVDVHIRRLRGKLVFIIGIGVVMVMVSFLSIITMNERI